MQDWEKDSAVGGWDPKSKTPRRGRSDQTTSQAASARTSTQGSFPSGLRRQAPSHVNYATAAAQGLAPPGLSLSDQRYRKDQKHNQNSTNKSAVKKSSRESTNPFAILSGEDNLSAVSSDTIHATSSRANLDKPTGFQPHLQGVGQEDIPGRTWPKPPPRIIATELDNAARKQWRHKVKARGTMQLNRTFIEVDTKNPWDVLRTASFPKIDRLATATGTHIQVKRDPTSDELVTLQFWGDSQKITNAKQTISGWISELGGKSPLAARWAKVWNLTPELKEKLDLKLAVDERRQVFRQQPDASATFPAYGWFEWPADEYPPEDVLGKSYEALDPIRMDFSCYIIWDEKRSSLKLMGNDPDMVRTASIRVRGAFFQVVARYIDVGHIYLLQIPTNGRAPLNTRILEYCAPRVLGRESNPKTKEVAVKADLEQAGDWSERNLLQESGHRSRLNAKRMREITLRLLDRLRYYKGNLTLQFRLGAFVLQRYRPPPSAGWPFEDLEKMLKEQQFEGMVSQEIGNTQLEKELLERIYGAGTLLQPSSTVSRTLRDDKPIYSGMFIVRDSGDRGDLRCEIIFKDLGDTIERNSLHWSRLDPGSRTPTKLLDIPLVDLRKGSAWALEVTATQTILDTSQIPSSLLQWAQKVEIDGRRARDLVAPKRFLKFPGDARVFYYEQKVAWTFNLTGSQYQVEIARTEHMDMSARGQSAEPAAAFSYNVLEPRWSVTVRHDEWRSLLGSHPNLKVGEGSKYEINAMKWFPRDRNLDYGNETKKDQDGFANLLEKLGKIERVVRGEGREPQGGAKKTKSIMPSAGDDDELYGLG